EEFLDGRDDDGDGEVDEDLGVMGTQELYARYTDDQPEAVQFGYLNGEPHVPLGLDVKQEAFTWAIPGFDRVAGLRFKITNHGTQPIADVRLGFLAALDARTAGSAGGHLDDLAGRRSYRETFFDGQSRIRNVMRFDAGSDPVPYFKDCFTTQS